ncbi:transglycosylase SLT domain-containing protein [Aminicella lysinilytica]|uniref:transglycosylase SLT domain-containing protein n=1 Tax=Aminicella lysinilytica TaxID=433323 RepID=UPI00179108E9|nr:transglycosylase SLT domain-containing protein [Aminicella lysinilytica]NLD11330.1 transglycosylase SLT domain-containing protein [Clostridiales bacterium]
MIKKIFTVLIALTIVTTSAGMVFADDSTTDATATSGTATAETTTGSTETTATAEADNNASAEATAKAEAEAKATAAKKAEAQKKAAAKKAKALKYKKGLAAYIRGVNGNYSKAGSMKLAGYFISYGKKYNVSPLALMAMARHESGFSARAHNPAGYYGMMQTSASLGRAKGFSKRELLVAKNSIKVAASYLRYNLKYFNYNYSKGIAGYCCGTYAVKTGHYSKTTSNARVRTMKSIKKYLVRHNYV